MKPAFTFLFLLAAVSSFAQGWIQKAPLPENARAGNSFAAVAGQKAYVMGGALGARNMEYDYATNSWTQKNNTGSQLRSWANAYSVNDTVYYGLGSVSWPNSVADINTFYKYNQATDAFTAVQLFPGCPRWVSTGFTIGNKFYITTGSPTYISCPSASISSMNDLWSYNTTTNTFTQLAALPFYRQGANGFSIHGKGYLVGGLYNGGTYSQLYCYDTLSNTWAAKASLPEVNYSGSTFVVNGKAYYITNGVSVSHVYEYDPVANTWTQLSDFPGFGRGLNASAFSIGNKGFVVGGYGNEYPPSNPANITNKYHKDLWEFNPDCPTNILNNFYYLPYEDTFCNYVHIDTLYGDSVTYPGTTYQWFASTDNISYQAVPGGTSHYLTGLSIAQTSYYKRATYCTAGCHDTSAPVKIVIIPFDTTFTVLPSATLCPGDTALLCSVPGQGYKEWFKDGDYILSSPGILNNDDTVAVTADGNYYFVLQNTASCYDTSTFITISHFSPVPPVITQDSNTVSVPGIYQSYQWYNAAHTAQANGATATFTPPAQGDYYVKVVDSNGCTVSSALFTFVPPPPPPPPTGVGTVPLKDYAAVAPNPFSDRLTLRFHKVIRASVRLVNIVGAVIDVQNVAGTEYSWDTGKYPAGIYFMEINAPGMDTYRVKLIKL